MSFFKNLFDGEKVNAQRQQEVARVITKKKTEFDIAMKKIQKQTRTVKKQTERSLRESERLVELVDSVTKDIAEATGGFR